MPNSAYHRSPPHFWVGIDSGVSVSAVCILDGSGNIVAQETLGSKAPIIANFLSTHIAGLPLTVTMESCSTSLQITKGLRALGYTVFVYDTFQIKRFAEIRKNKTDTNDARSIAEVGRLGHGYLTAVHVKSHECMALRSKLILRHNFVRQKVRTEQLMRSTFRLYGVRLPNRPSNVAIFERMIEDQMRVVHAEADADISASITPLLSVAVGLRREIARLDSEIAEFAKTNELCARFMEIPAVSSITAVSLYSAIEEPSRFSRATDVPAYLGLTPKISQSGETLKVKGISKAGNVMTRTHLVTAATVLLTVVKKESALREWGLGKVTTIGLPKARVAVARKLSVLMFTLWRDGTRFEAFPDPSVGRTDIAVKAA